MPKQFLYTLTTLDGSVQSGAFAPIALADLPGNVGAIVQLTSNQSIPNSATTPISFDTVTRDDSTFFSGGSPTKLTVQKTGWHVITIHVKWAGNVTGKRVMDFRFNGATFRNSTSVGPDAGNNDPDQASGIVYYLSAGDYVELTVFQNSAGALNATSAEMEIIQL